MPALVEPTPEVAGLQIVGHGKLASDLGQHLDFDGYLETSKSPPGFGLHYTLCAAVHLGLDANDGALWQTYPLVANKRSNRSVLGQCKSTDDDLSLFYFDKTDTQFHSICISKSAKSSQHSVLSPTVPESPSLPNLKQKKKVSFADDYGLILVTVNLIYHETDDDDFCAKSFFENFYKPRTSAVGITRRKNKCYMNYRFTMPVWDQPKFMEKVNCQNVSLESVCMLDNDNKLSGTVKVKNIAFEKKVFIRCTFDQWSTFTEYQCVYKPSSQTSLHNDSYDSFSFQIILPMNAAVTSAQFAVCYIVEGQEFWDNNAMKNYQFEFSTLPT